MPISPLRQDMEQVYPSLRKLMTSPEESEAEQLQRLTDWVNSLSTGKNIKVGLT
jgi:hypothetical protein